MKPIEFRGALQAGFTLLLIVNGAILATAGWNRWDSARAEITLTERELSLPAYREEDNSGLALSLVLGDTTPPVVKRVAWRKRHQIPRARHPWLDKAKRAELGFRTDLDPSDPSAREAFNAEAARRVYLVLELEGEAWRLWLAAQEEHLRELRLLVESSTKNRLELQDAEALLALDRLMRSRLFPIDAGLNLESLERRYPDRKRYIVVRGLIEIGITLPEAGVPWVHANMEVLPDQVHVPYGVRAQLVPFLPQETREEAWQRESKEREASWPAPSNPRYRVALAFGRRLEPWIVRVTPVGQETAGLLDR